MAEIKASLFAADGSSKGTVNLDPDIFGPSYTAFSHRYAIFGGYQNYEVVGYQNEPELSEKIHSIAFFAPGKQPMGVVGFRPAEQLEAQFNLASYPKFEAAAAAAAASTESDTGSAASDAA